MKGDWARTLCEHCYGVLVHQQREGAEKKPATADGRAAVPRQHPPAKAQPRQPKRKPPQPIPPRERRRRQRRTPAESSLLEFFRAAGIRAELLDGGCLWVNGSQIELRWMMPAHTPLDLNGIIDEISLKYIRDEFIRAVEENARFGEGLRVELQRHERGFVVMRDDIRLAVLHANRAQIPGRDVIHANFLVPGPQWRQVADVLHDAEPELVAEWTLRQQAKAVAEATAAATTARRRHAAARRYIDRMPDDIAPDLINACLDASRRIRLERQLAYARPVVLECTAGRLTLLPIAESRTGLLIPFRLSTGMQALSAELALTDRDPLPLLIGEDVTEQDAITAWACALLGFADATCIELEPTGPPARREPRPRIHPPSPVPPHPTAQTLPRNHRWPGHLEPVGHWIRYSGSFVAGHRRRLNDDQFASPQARDRARQVGIILRPHETWVRPHARGVPEGIEMRFLWHAPAELNLTLTLT